MSDLFSGNSLVEIEIFYTVDKNRYNVARVEVLTDEKAVEMQKGPDKAKVRSIKTKWKMPSWKTANDLLSQSTTFNAMNQPDIDWTRYRDARLKASLVEWSGQDVADIPCTPDNINKLHPSVAVALLEKFDQVTTIDKEEIQKNL